MIGPLIHPETIPVLETGRLLLRPYNAGDAESLYHLFTSEEVIISFGYRMEPAPEAVRSIMKRWEEEFKNGTGIRWAILEKASGNMIGNIGLKDIKAYHKCGAAGYALLPGYWRKGFATEAMEAMLEYVFRVMGLHRVEAVVFLYNDASQALLHRLGFHREGILRSAYRFDGAFHDSYLYALINKRGVN